MTTFAAMGPADVAIVGGGASGTLVAVQLLRQARGPLRVALVERSGALARGLAYGPAEPCHVLNVPAGRMSALPEDPDHFVRWCGAGPDEFVGRATYGAYLEALLSEARQEIRQRVADEEERKALHYRILNSDIMDHLKRNSSTRVTR